MDYVKLDGRGRGERCFSANTNVGNPSEVLAEWSPRPRPRPTSWRRDYGETILVKNALFGSSR
jgi:hypothetical protein